MSTPFKPWGPAVEVPQGQRDEWAIEQLIEMARKATAEGKDRSFDATTTSSGDSMVVTTSILMKDGSRLITQYDLFIRRHRAEYIKPD